MSEGTALAQIVSFATIGISFLFRPLGAIVAGHLGDKLGRKQMLVFTLIMMGAATALIGVLPTYAQIGIAAPILLVVLRILQGFSAGGEWGGAALLSVEHAPGEQARLLRRLPADRRSGRHDPGDRSSCLCMLQHPDRGGLPGLGLAHSVPVLRGADRRGLLHPPLGG